MITDRMFKDVHEYLTLGWVVDDSFVQRQRAILRNWDNARTGKRTIQVLGHCYWEAIMGGGNDD